MDTNTTGLYSDSRQAPYNMVRSERTQLLSKMTFPPSYTSNTVKETVCLDFVEDFRAQYSHLFPLRAPLLLAPVNECLRPKFISTFIRPTLLPYIETYDYEACAKFVSAYITYDPLEDPEALPHRLVSPTTVLAWQVGNCVEMSMVLTSLLIGAGYNAAVVIGYASREVVECDLTATPWGGKIPDEPISEDDTDSVDTSIDTRFAPFLKKRPALQSGFDAFEAAAAEKARNKAGDGALGGDEGQGTAEDKKKLCHCWVVLLPKKRKIEAPIFIEPSTGSIVSLDDPRYHNIEALFNHQNYFVNMDPDAPPSKLNFDLYDLTTWEHVFLSDPQLVDEDHGDRDRDSDRAKAEAATLDNGESGDRLIDLPASWVDALTINRMQYENRYPGRSKTVRYADAIVQSFAEYSDPDLRTLVIKVPDDLAVHRHQVHTFYSHRKDLLRRESVFPSLDRGTEPRKRHQWFLPGRKREFKVEGLRELIDEPGVRRTLSFWWRAREDGLASRTELFFSDKDPHPKKIIELYRGRMEDRLWYRSATYEAAKEGTGIGAIGLPGTMHRGDQLHRETETTRHPIKMTEKFRRNPALKASADVMKRSFIKPLQTDGEVWVWYHYLPDSITRGFRLYPKATERERDLASNGGDGAGSQQARVVVMPLEEPPRPHQLREELKALIAAEKECLNDMRTKTEDCKEILTQLSNPPADQDSDGNRLLSVYDTLRKRRKETEAERERLRREDQRRAESRLDYLAAYIGALDIERSLNGDYARAKLSAQNAKQVRDAALKDLKERLIQRGHIMQARMDREKEELTKRQIAYQKNLDTTENVKENEGFTEFLAKATWRMKILDDRLTRHIEQASEKYAELAQKLAGDPRLAAIYEGAK